MKIEGMVVFFITEGIKEMEDLEKLLMTIFQIDVAQQKCDHSSLCTENNLKL
jgi:hypothetical protein